MPQTSHNANDHVKRFVRGLGNDLDCHQSDNARMAGKAKTASANHLRAWRVFRRMTQQQLAEAADTANNVISQLESGERGLSDKWLRRLAPALGTTPGFLLDHDPADLDTDLIRIAMGVPADRQAEAAEVLKVLARRR